jgi:hypothetical protein
MCLKLNELYNNTIENIQISCILVFNEAELKHGSWGHRNIAMYFTVMGTARSPMPAFWLDCCFKGFQISRKNSVLTPRYVNRLSAMRHSAEF